MKIFLDVGAHTGETLLAVIDPRFRFDRIVAFEPSEECLKPLSRFRDSRVAICPFGLWKETCDLPLFEPGTVGATIFSDKTYRSAPKGTSTPAHFVRASDWLAANTGQGDEVYLKINTEGSECDILDDLILSGEISRVTAALVHFDVQKIPSQRHRESEVRDQLVKAGFARLTTKEDLRAWPTYYGRVQGWLGLEGADEYDRLSGLARVHSQLRALRYMGTPRALTSLGIRRLAHTVLPERTFSEFWGYIRGYRRES